MASNYTAFDVLVDNDDGTTTPLPSQTVHVYDVTNDEALDDLTTDGDGHIDAGTLDVDPATVVRFHITLANGQCGYKEDVTT